MRVLLIADDLTGAADSAVAFARDRSPVRLVTSSMPLDVLDGALERANREDAVLAVDTDTRDRDPAEAADRLRELIARPAMHAHRGWTFKKVDSLLRGPIAAELAVLRAAGLADRVECAPALPALGRTTLDGRQLLEGRPVDRSGGEDPRGHAADARVAQAIGLDDTDGPVRIHDAATDADLDALAASLPSPPHEPPLLLVGSSGLAGALARRLAGGREEAADAGTTHTTRSPAEPGPSDPVPVLVVSLSPSRIARAQVAQLLEARPDTTHVRIQPNQDADELAALGSTLAAAQTADAALALVTIDAVDDPALHRRRAQLLDRVRTVLRGGGHWPAVVANGGDATRCVLEASGASSLQVRAPAGVGVVRCALDTDEGHRTDLVTKSGSFGEPGALLAAVDELVALTTLPQGA